jgi:hypothetical protein
MRTFYPISHHRTTTGQSFIICPCPRFIGVTVDPTGKPVALKYPDPTNYDWESEEEEPWKPYKDLRGLNVADVERYKPDFILYRLGDQSYLKADQAAIKAAGRAENVACSYGQASLKHWVKDLTIAEMPELEDLPVFHLG